MILIGLIIVYLLGFAITFFFSQFDEKGELTFLEYLGLSFLIGIGVETVYMFGLDLLHIRISILSLLIPSLAVTGIIIWMKRESLQKLLQNISFKSIKQDLELMDLPWLTVLAIIIFLLIGSVAKSLYWPTAAYDSVAGYDMMAKAIAAEGRIAMSLFDLDVQGSRGIYPPLTEGSFAFAYIFGSNSSKIITTLTYLSLVMIFYALLRKYVNRLNAIIFCLVLIVTPEMFAHSSLSLTNMPGAAYAGLGLIYLFVWFDRKMESHLFIASILLGLNVWLRNDGVAFGGAGLLLLAYYAIRNKTWKELAIYTGIAFLPFIVWTAYLKYVIGFTQNRFVEHLFWDATRFKGLLNWVIDFLTNTNLYGLTFYIFFISVLINIKNLVRDKSIFLLLIVFSFALYSAIYYQLDDSVLGTLDVMMSKSYKRALFYFVPLAVFYASTNKTVHQLFQSIDDFRMGKSGSGRKAA